MVGCQCIGANPANHQADLRQALDMSPKPAGALQLPSVPSAKRGNDNTPHCACMVSTAPSLLIEKQNQNARQKSDTPP